MTETQFKQFDIRWRDAGKAPQCPPDPAYPEGVDLDISAGAAKCCTTTLPYPAWRIGSYLVTCTLCGMRVACTTAGRPDDPRSLKLPCRAKASA